MWIKFGILAALAAGFFARSSYERKQISTEVFTVESDKLKKPERRFIFLSDLHSNSFGEGNRKLLEAIRQVKPDGILIGGDMMVCKGKQEVSTALSLVRELAAAYPVYYGNGNHESRMNQERVVYGDLYDKYLEELLKAGVIYLSDESSWIDQDIRISALDIEKKYYKKFKVSAMTTQEMEEKLGKSEKDGFQILLSHSPLFFKSYASWGADLTLAGHFHGGTVRIPFLGGLMTPQFQFFLPWCGGEFCEEGKRMIVSRGLGTHSINIRFNNKPQLVVLALRNPYLL